MADQRVGLSLVASAVCAAILVGCVGSGDAGKLRQQAEAALARWADAVVAARGPSAVIPVGELTRQLGDWEAEVGDNNKPALMGGLVEAAAELPVELPPDGDVTWSDGTTTTVHLMSAAEAIAALRAGTTAPCGDCIPLRITGALLTSGPIETTHGPATAPIWEFTIERSAVKVTHLAVANRVVVLPQAWDSNDPPVGVWLDSAQASASGSEIIVAFVGAPLPGDQSCGEDYTADPVESDLAVVVIVVRHPHLTLGACTGLGAPRTAVVKLAAPLGDRAVLQVYDGTPVRIDLAP
jgi:hypothetical protein